MINSLTKDSHMAHYRYTSSQCLLPKSACKTKVKNEIVSNYDISMKKPAEINFCGFLNAKKIYKSNALKKIIEFAEKQQLVFSAGFALLITGTLRPASIMLLPGKKNKDDKKYASAQSIASGVIGLGISTILFMPISNGVKKFAEKATSYIKNHSSYLLEQKDRIVDKNGVKSIIKKGDLTSSGKIATTYIDRLPDIIGSVPKGILTIVLIPPILKYVFGIEKGKKSPAEDKIHSPIDYYTLNFKSTEFKNRKTFQGFQGGLK